MIAGTVGRELQGTIGSIQRMVQNLGIVLGTSVSTSLIYAHSSLGTFGFITEFRNSWYFGLALISLGLLSFSLNITKQTQIYHTKSR